MSRINTLIRSLSRKERTIFWGAAIMVALSFIVLIGFLFTTKTTAVPTQGGEYTEGMVGQPTYINPIMAETLTDTSLVRMIFAPLTDLTEIIEPTVDGRTWKVRLKENLTWSDGTPLTSDDVIFSTQSIQNPESDAALFGSWQGVAVHRVSQLEIQFNLANPYAFFNDTLRELYIIPKHIFADVPLRNWRLSEYNLKPVGSGPYMVAASHIRSDGFIERYDLKTNPHYAGGAPFIDPISFHFFTKTEDAINAFNAGQIDGVMNLSSDEQSKIERPYEPISFSLPNYYAVFINQSTNLALQDPWVRKALNLAIDRNALVAHVFQGKADEATGPIPKSMGDLALVSTATSSNPAALLDAHGWKMASSTFREKKTGNVGLRLRIELTVPHISFLQQTAELLKNTWQNIGVDVAIIDVAPEKLSDVVKNRTYQTILFGNILHRNPDLFSFWHSSERFSPGLNLSLYSNKKADALIESIRGNMNEAKRTEDLMNLQKIILDDTPAFFLYSPYYLGAATKDLQGIDPSTIGGSADAFSGAGKWYLKTTRVIK